MRWSTGRRRCGFPSHRKTLPTPAWREGRNAQPSAAIIDSQSVEGASSLPAASRGYGYGGGKKLNGRRRHVIQIVGAPHERYREEVLARVVPRDAADPLILADPRCPWRNRAPSVRAGRPAAGSRAGSGS